ncbi:MAG: proteasome subunit alpha, partial [Candidatus Micrarchaeota archaeon]|nr:proteasome subunit alpha [Candidatus Micrarchaeota archaeon]
MVSDGLHLVNVARNNAQNHRLLFSEVKSVEALAKEISSYMMQATMYGGMRPYAVSVLLGGIDTQPRLFEIEPGASFLGYKADAIGVGKKIATDVLVKEYKDKMKLEDGIDLGVRIIKKVNEGKLTTDNIDIGYIQDAEEYTMLSSNEISKYL